MRYAVKNWRTFQHYTGRTPPWIKLQRSILDDHDFQRLPIASKALAPMIWLLASESEDGSVDCDAAKLAWRLRWNEKDVKSGLTALIENGFLSHASGVLAERLQDACREREGEGEAERERETEVEADAPLAVAGLNAEAWETWISYRTKIRKPLKQVSIPAAQNSLAAFGSNQKAVVEQSIANGWTGLFELKTKPQPAGRDADRARASELLTGRGKNERNERDITGESQRIA